MKNFRINFFQGLNGKLREIIVRDKAVVKIRSFKVELSLTPAGRKLLLNGNISEIAQSIKPYYKKWSVGGVLINDITASSTDKIDKSYFINEIKRSKNKGNEAENKQIILKYQRDSFPSGCMTTKCLEDKLGKYHFRFFLP